MEELKQETLGTLLVQLNLIQHHHIPMLTPVLVSVVMVFIIPVAMVVLEEAVGMVVQAHIQMVPEMMTVVAVEDLDMFIPDQLHLIIHLDVC